MEGEAKQGGEIARYHFWVLAPPTFLDVPEHSRLVLNTLWYTLSRSETFQDALGRCPHSKNVPATACWVSLGRCIRIEKGRVEDATGDKVDWVGFEPQTSESNICYLFCFND